MLFYIKIVSCHASYFVTKGNKSIGEDRFFYLKNNHSNPSDSHKYYSISKYQSACMQIVLAGFIMVLSRLNCKTIIVIHAGTLYFCRQSKFNRQLLVVLRKKENFPYQTTNNSVAASSVLAYIIICTCSLFISKITVHYLCSKAFFYNFYGALNVL